MGDWCRCADAGFRQSRPAESKDGRFIRRRNPLRTLATSCSRRIVTAQLYRAGFGFLFTDQSEPLWFRLTYKARMVVPVLNGLPTNFRQFNFSGFRLISIDRTGSQAGKPVRVSPTNENNLSDSFFFPIPLNYPQIICTTHHYLLLYGIYCGIRQTPQRCPDSARNNAALNLLKTGQYCRFRRGKRLQRTSEAEPESPWDLRHI